MFDLEAQAAQLRQHGFHVVNRCFFAAQGWLVRRSLAPDSKGVWVYPRGEHWRLHLEPYGTGMHWIRDVDGASLETELERALELVHEADCPDGWQLGLTAMIVNRLRALPGDPAAVRRLLEEKSARSATPWQHAPGLIRLHLAGQFEDVERPEYDRRFGIAVVPTEADLLPIFEEARACLQDRLGLGEPGSYGVRWHLGAFVVALLHTDAIGDGHIGEGKTVEVRVFDPAVVTEPTRIGFAWPDPEDIGETLGSDD